MYNYKDYKVNQELSTDDRIVLVKRKGEVNIKTWSSLETISGWYINSVGILGELQRTKTGQTNRHTWATKEQAEASIALAMLSQLMKDVNGDWAPDWTKDTLKFTIRHWRGKVSKLDHWFSHDFLAFETVEIRDEFLENHKELIERAKSLI